MSEHPPIQQVLADVMCTVSHVAKRDRNTHQGFNFRGIDAVVNAVGPALREHRVLVIPNVTDTKWADVQTSKGKPAIACRVTVSYTFHGPAGDALTCSVVGEAWDHGDKATPKAMSVAFRTALLQALCLPTDEPDPDESTFEAAPPARIPIGVAKQRILDACTQLGVDDPADLAKTIWVEELGNPQGPFTVAEVEAMVASVEAPFPTQPTES